MTGLTSLESFYFHNNAGICAPVDQIFQAWLQSIPIAIGSSCAPMDSTGDRNVLVELYNELDGTNWYRSADWLTSKRLREWQGVTNDAAGRVDRLYLAGNRLNGEIPVELGQLSNMKLLAMSFNQLTGEIPPELGALTKIETLFLRSNSLTGDIPPELGSMTSLEKLYLGSNRLTGEIPSELGDLENLQLLELRNNQLTGHIPPELGELGNLEILSLHANGLTGEIPDELENIPGLRSLSLAGNELTGCIPAGLRDVENNDLGELGLPFCDVVLNGLTISPGGLIQPFDPYRTDYSLAVGQSQDHILSLQRPQCLIHVLPRRIRRRECDCGSGAGGRGPRATGVPGRFRTQSARDQDKGHLRGRSG